MIQLKNVHKAFGPKQILRGFTLDVPDGETMVIIGYSGTGKSVAIKHVVGLLQPDEGEVWVDGLRVDTLPRKQLYALRARIGYVFQFAALFDSLTIGENVAMGLRKQGGLTEAEVQGRVAEALDLVDLPGVERRFPAELSGGMRKRVGIARAIVGRPQILLYDEPVTGLDPVNGTVVHRLIARLGAELGVTSIIVTHDIEGTLPISDRVAMLDHGFIRFVGTADEFRDSDDPLVRAFLERDVPDNDELLV